MPDLFPACLAAGSGGVHDWQSLGGGLRLCRHCRFWEWQNTLRQRVVVEPGQVLQAWVARDGAIVGPAWLSESREPVRTEVPAVFRWEERDDD